MGVAHVNNGSIVELQPGAVYINDAVQSYETILIWTEEYRNSQNVYSIQEPGQTPQGKVLVSTELQFDNGLVVRVPAYEDIPLETLKVDKLSELADLRWNRCQSFVYDGVTAPADPALTAVTGAVVAAQVSSSTAATTWKLAPGHFRQWTPTQIIGYGLAIRGHVQACFNLEEALSDMIDAAVDADELAAIDFNTGWPT